MAEEIGLSHTTIRRPAVHLQRKCHDRGNAFALQPHRAETFKLSTDPLFVDKAQDVVGLYMSLPNRARAMRESRGAMRENG